MTEPLVCAAFAPLDEDERADASCTAHLLRRRAKDLRALAATDARPCPSCAPPAASMP